MFKGRKGFWTFLHAASDIGRTPLRHVLIPVQTHETTIIQLAYCFQFYRATIGTTATDQSIEILFKPTYFLRTSHDHIQPTSDKTCRSSECMGC